MIIHKITIHATNVSMPQVTMYLNLSFDAGKMSITFDVPLANHLDRHHLIIVINSSLVHEPVLPMSQSLLEREVTPTPLPLLLLLFFLHLQQSNILYHNMFEFSICCTSRASECDLLLYHSDTLKRCCLSMCSWYSWVIDGL